AARAGVARRSGRPLEGHPGLHALRACRAREPAAHGRVPRAVASRPAACPLRRFARDPGPPRPRSRDPKARGERRRRRDPSPSAGAGGGAARDRGQRHARARALLRALARRGRAAGRGRVAARGNRAVGLLTPRTARRAGRPMVRFRLLRPRPVALLLAGATACARVALAAVTPATSAAPPPLRTPFPDRIRLGFVETVIADSLDSPVSMATAPDGRVFVCEQGGRLRVVRNDALLARPFVTLPVGVGEEEGLLGVAFDPGFESNHRVYV